MAQTNLGSMYEQGQGIPQDYAQAALWWRKAAEQNDARAQFLLGILYREGEGVPRNPAEAYFWFDLAASGKLEIVTPEEVAKSRDDAASHLTAAVLLQTQGRARRWFEAHAAKSNPQ